MIAFGERSAPGLLLAVRRHSSGGPRLPGHYWMIHGMPPLLFGVPAPRAGGSATYADAASLSISVRYLPSAAALSHLAR
jgi:hypothetical protein